MYIKNIAIKNFRNYEKEEIKLSKDINVFFGNNAQGKTNIIEAIFICSMGKSFRTKKDKELIKFNEKESEIEIGYQKIDREGTIKYILNEKKCMFLNKVPIRKLSEILGNINIVMFSPEDINIIKNGPSRRRKFLNMLISQLRPQYIYNYNMYMKVLEEKNNYLKKIKLQYKDNNLLDIYDEKLSEYGNNINQYRNEFINKIKNKIEKIHRQITEEKEEINIKYISDCFDKKEYYEELIINREEDIKRGYTKKGIHRDDIVFYINHKQVDIYGSQGQQRTAILSLKLAELEVIYDELGEYPILLLDDFMSELDETRKKAFLKNIKNTQIIITCTDDIVIDNLQINKFKVEKGKITKINNS